MSCLRLASCCSTTDIFRGCYPLVCGLDHQPPLKNRYVPRRQARNEERLLTGSPSVLSLFAGNPFPGAPPRQIRAVIWQYRLTGPAEKRQGFWWQRQFLGLYAPGLEREPDGKLAITDM